jgi:hypothetical protein
LIFFKLYQKFLIEEVDADLIDREGKIPANIIARLKEIKLFALKIGKEYEETALLSTHQSISVPQPLILFGTKEQKDEYLWLEEGIIELTQDQKNNL